MIILLHFLWTCMRVDLSQTSTVELWMLTKVDCFFQLLVICSKCGAGFIFMEGWVQENRWWLIFFFTVVPSKASEEFIFISSCLTFTRGKNVQCLHMEHECLLLLRFEMHKESFTMNSFESDSCTLNCRCEAFSESTNPRRFSLGHYWLHWHNRMHLAA